VLTQPATPTSIDTFIQELDKTAHQLNIFLKTIDKKKEKQFLNQVKEQLHAVIPHIIDPQQLLGSLYQYMILNSRQLLLFISWRHVQYLVPLLPREQEYTLFEQLVPLVEEYSSVNQSLEDKTKLEQLLGQLKTITW
jgi:hypothetical protein